MAGSLVIGILGLGFLIVVHEAGHYIVARLCRMRVERFSIGFGPGILKHKGKHGTVFQLAPLPFGGFVEIRGMNIAEEVDPDDVQAYPNRPAWQRFLTILAGPATNYISAVFLAFGLYTCDGMAGDTYHVGAVSEGYDAVGKLQPNDRITEVNGVPMFSPSPDQLHDVLAKNPGAPVELTVVRHNFQQLKITIHPKPQLDKNGNPIYRDGKKVFLIGIMPQRDLVDVSIGTAAASAIKYPVVQTQAILHALHDIFTGKEEADPGGPVRIVKELENAVSRGFADFIKLLMVLSVYLGLFNLFPLPALDGGRLVFLTYEMVTRRRANPKLETMVHMGGIMVLMVVMILVTLRDFNVF